MDNAFAHLFEQRLRRREGGILSSAHERQRRALGAASSPGHGRVDRTHSRRCGKRMGATGAFHVDGGRINEERALASRNQRLGPDRNDMPTRRKHRHNRVRVPHRLDGAGGDGNAAGGSGRAGGRDEIEANDSMARLDEIDRHGPAHVAQTDECDIRHTVCSPSLQRPTISRAMMTRMISLVPSRIWCTRRSRTSFSTP